jgi:hypothetical protein
MALIEGLEGRYQAVQDVARRFEVGHLTDPDARQIGMACARLASEMIMRIRDDPELTRALSSLANARDGFIRAKMYQKNGSGE